MTEVPSTLGQNQEPTGEKPHVAPKLRKHGDLRQITFSTHGQQGTEGAPQKEEEPVYQGPSRLTPGERLKLIEEGTPKAAAQLGIKGDRGSWAPQAEATLQRARRSAEQSIGLQGRKS